MKLPTARLAVRIFLLAFLPVSAAVIGSFLVFRPTLENSLRTHLRQNLLSTEQTFEIVRSGAESQHEHLVATFAENASLKAGFGLWREIGREDARKTVEDQLLDLAPGLRYELVAAFDAADRPIAAILRRNGTMTALPEQSIPGLHGRLGELEGKLFQITTVPVNLGNEYIGRLSVGRTFDLSELPGGAVLIHNGRLLRSSLDDIPAAEVEAAIGGCIAMSGDCSVRLRGEQFLVSLSRTNLGPGYALWSFQSLDAASSSLLRAQTNALLAMALSTLLAALLTAFFASRSVVAPITRLVAKLRQSEHTGVLRGDFDEHSPVTEVNELGTAFNAAARSIAGAQRQLDEAYLEFTKTMAQTLDARDPYTAGHSTRVSDYAVAIAEALNLSLAETENLRVAANLHDIGKIGVPDNVLQKPGKLTSEEMEVIKRHPLIGKRILEGVAKFRDYLAVVELHHENHDGTGYPWGLNGEETPLGARIVHVVDAFDAMTTSRPYRDAMPQAKALQILQQFAGTQFDPAIVEVFLRLVHRDPSALPGSVAEQLHSLDRAVSGDRTEPAQIEAAPVDMWRQ
jgi:HD-GYP domain-containing protein (c-di-GMP phosphodiesterase class II)